MKITSIEQLKQLFWIVDNGDVIITNEVNVDQMNRKEGFTGGGINYDLFTGKVPDVGNKKYVSYMGKTICIVVIEKESA